MKICILVDNGNKVKFIDKFFIHTNKLLIFKLERYINLMLGNSKVYQKLIKKAFMNVIIRDHSK